MAENETAAAAPRASKGAVWSAADFWMQQVSQLLTFILIGNVLGPETVGVMNMALVAVLFFATFLENGFGDALIQRGELSAEHFSSTFWLMLGIGVIEALLLIAGTPLVAGFFSEPRLKAILPLMAVGLPFIAVTACYAGILQRRLMFRQLAIRSILAYGLGFVAAFIFMRLGFGLYSLVSFFLVSRILDAILVVLVSGMWPGFKARRDALWEIVDYGRHRVAHQAVSYMTFQFDRIVIGYFLGPTALGLYSTAERMVSALNNGISGVLQRVAFPVLSARQKDRPAFDGAMRDFINASNVISLPVFFGLAATAPALIGTLFSARWMPAALLMQLLCFAAMAQPSNYVLTAATNALGFPKTVLKISIVVLVMRWTASLIAAQFNVETVAFANAGVYLLSLPVFVIVAHGLFRGRWTWLFGEVPGPLAAVLVMAVVAYAVGMLLPGAPAFEVLVAQAAAGVASYVLCLKLFAPALFDRALLLVTRRAATGPA
jgi:polysaccharide transporter, PST family